MKNFKQLLLLFMAIAVLSSCVKEEDSTEETADSDPVEGEVTLSRETGFGDEEDWIYYSFESNEELTGIDESNYQTNTTWDIAFNRQNVRTNGGTSGAGEAAVIDMGELDFNAVNSAPESGYTVDSTIEIVANLSTFPPPMMNTNGNTLLSSAIIFSGPPPVYEPNNHIYVMKTANGNYAKIQIISFYDTDGESGFVSFKFFYQADGTRSF